jgi:F-type H+-transporting ATPase subunit a
MAGPAAGHAAEHGSQFTEHAHWLEMIPGFRALDQRFAEALQFFQVGEAGAGGHLSAYQVFMALIVLVAITAALLKAGLNRLGAEDRIVPESTLTIRTFFELIVESVLGMMRDIIGPTADRFLPLIGTLAIFIFVSNVLALVPGFQPPTANLNTTLALALPVFFATHFFGVKEHGLAYFKHFFGPILKWYALPLMAIMLLIEIISHLARPLSLSLRLLGNMFGDHQVLAVFMGLLAVPLLYPIPIVALGLVVCIVQTLVFCLLSMVYIGLAVAHEDH